MHKAIRLLRRWYYANASVHFAIAVLSVVVSLLGYLWGHEILTP